MTNRQVLLLIAAFIALILGSFIWFIATWSAEEEPSLSFILEEKLPPEAPDFARKIRFMTVQGGIL
ncbi:hypothetical protein [Flavimaricola marinus]|uniref:Uncharacterized protein n=1 Tax=Flavimaricola marinus TaxID=1819565 RepID=A0A238LCP4_9RHOB|nr:hypothetical protein [Flavimaricola marinus]SMY06706.1 hypothetical protein LOM8899_00834 [Flavimaricola marinus]